MSVWYVPIYCGLLYVPSFKKMMSCLNIHRLKMLAHFWIRRLYIYLESRKLIPFNPNLESGSFAGITKVSIGILKKGINKTE